MNHIDEETFTKTYVLLKDILMTSYKIECIYFDNLETANASLIDRGIRNIMWENFEDDEKHVSWFYDLIDQDFFLVVRSNLGFYNLTVNLISDGIPHFYSVGPFRSEDASANYFEDIIKNAGIPADKMLQTEMIFRMLPEAGLSTVVNITKRILSEYIPEINNIEVQYKTFENEKHTANENPDTSQLQNSNIIKYKEYYIEYKESIYTCNSQHARTILNNFLTLREFDKLQTISQLKIFLRKLNDFHMGLFLDSDINPVFIVRLHSKIDKEIEQTNNHASLYYKPYDIGHKYILLVKNYSHNSYSRLVREIIDYIELNLEDDLSLNTIAAHFNRNPSSLSTTFKKETDTTLTNYVKETRIRHAQKLLNSTELSISEISLAIGYEDFAYFSRVFKQITGLSPREYQKAIKKESSN